MLLDCRARGPEMSNDLQPHVRTVKTSGGGPGEGLQLDQAEEEGSEQITCRQSTGRDGRLKIRLRKGGYHRGIGIAPQVYTKKKRKILRKDLE